MLLKFKQFIQRKSQNPGNLPVIILVTATFIWGSTFLIGKIGVTSSGALFLTGTRFLFAAILALIFFAKNLKGINFYDISRGTLLGITMAAGYCLQFVGLSDISSSESAFITAVYVPLVPIFQWLLFRNRPNFIIIFAIIMAFVGVLLVAWKPGIHLSLNQGQLITLLGAFAIALEIILMGQYTKRIATAKLVVIQLFSASICSFLVMFILHEPLPDFHKIIWWPIIYLTLCSTFIQIGMTWAQRYVTPTKATLIYSSESFWAGIIGALAGELLTIRIIIGGLLILLSNPISSIKLHQFRPIKLHHDKTDTDDT